MLFSGKVDLDDIPILIQMKKDGLIQKPKFFPEWVTDMNYLVSYFVFSNFVGKVDYDSVDDYYDSLFKMYVMHITGFVLYNLINSSGTKLFERCYIYYLWYIYNNLFLRKI